jgi:uncharacterized membrane protein HdeD (DUF308 family)
VYLASVLLLMVILPAISIAAEHISYGAAPLMSLVGKWFVFWAAGIRLLLAGLRQFFQPRFTSEKIFGIIGDDPLPFVRELGIANFSTGVAASLSLWRPTFVLPLATIAAIFYGVAGIRHAIEKHRNANENIAMVTDLLAALVFCAFLVFTYRVHAGL